MHTFNAPCALDNFSRALDFVLHTAMYGPPSHMHMDMDRMHGGCGHSGHLECIQKPIQYVPKGEQDEVNKLSPGSRLWDQEETISQYNFWVVGISSRL